jgi:hypothetical protein
LTCASTPHFQKQSSQKLGTTRSPSVCGSGGALGAALSQPLPIAAVRAAAPPAEAESRMN